MKRLIAMTLALLFAATIHAEPLAPDKAKAAVEKFITDAKVQGVETGSLQELSDPSLPKVFPSHRFFGLRFPMYPVARLAPEPLKNVNVFAVAGDGKVKLITAPDELFEFFKTTAAKEAPLRVTTAWGTLAKEFDDDGFFHLKLRPDWTKVEHVNGNMVLTLRVLAGPRTGYGEMRYILTFDTNGRLIAQRSENELHAGARPICQSLQLRDADPLVRAQAEAALLWMGRDALPYLCERAEAVEPPLREAMQVVIEKILKTRDEE